MNIIYLFSTKTNIKEYYLDPSSSTFIEMISGDKFIKDLSYPSILLNTLMLANIVSKFAPKNWKQICTTDINIKNAIIIVHKSFFGKRKLLCKLKTNKNMLVFAIVDGTGINLDLADAILCCSHASYQHYSTIQTQCPVFFVEHNVDIRIQPIQPYTDKFSAYYFGASENMYFYNSIFEYVRPCFSDYLGTAHTDFIRYLKFANFHYALRPTMPERVFKPFTKGFMASFHFSNILVHKNDGDASIYLGNDYPYLIKEDLTENIVINYIKKARDDFGGKDWNRGLEIMHSLRKFFDHKNIASQFITSMETLRIEHPVIPHLTLKQAYIGRNAIKDRIISLKNRLEKSRAWPIIRPYYVFLKNKIYKRDGPHNSDS